MRRVVVAIWIVASVSFLTTCASGMGTPAEPSAATPTQAGMDRFSPPTTKPAAEAIPPDKGASVAAAELLHYLTLLPVRRDERVLSGQNIGQGNGDITAGYQRFFAALQTKTGNEPAILGVDYGWEALNRGAIAKTNQILVRHWKEGGLVTISMSPRNPWTGGGVRDRSLRGFAYQNLMTPGTVPNRRWTKDLDAVAVGLAELQEAGVIVLWRPLHEMNGDFFWWSAGHENGWASAENYRALWVYVFEYLTQEKGLHNLLWVFAPNAQLGSAVKPVTYYYPGDDYVDVVGLDYYNNTLDQLNAFGSYEAIRALGKPIGLTEIGPAFWLKDHPWGHFDNRVVIDGIRDKYPEVVYFLYWHGWPTILGDIKMSIVENEHAVDLLEDPWVITKGEVHWR